MHDLRLVGVHDDGEHLVLSDGGDQRYLLAVDEALRAAVRRDRAHLGQLQIEIGGGLRPREVQARIRAGATAEEIAAAAGWPVEKVRRYEGPVLAEREHVASVARGVRLRRPGSEPVTLGGEVTRRLVARGVDAEAVQWDAWRADEGPWTVVVSFSAGGRDRQARWHLDLGTRSVTPADDEARWLSEHTPEGEGPLGGLRLAPMPHSSVYDIEADGGVEGRADGDARPGDPLDLMTAMRARRREREHRPASTRRSPGEGVSPSDVPGALHPARRRRSPAPEPLELDPTLLADPPAAHPPAVEPDLLSSSGLADDEVSAEAMLAEELGAEGSARPDLHTPQRWPLAAQMAQAPLPGDRVARLAPDVLVELEPVDVADTGELPAVTTPAHTADAERAALDVEVPARAEDRPATGATAADEAPEDESGPRHRAPAKARARRASVPSWDDIMFGAKRD